MIIYAHCNKMCNEFSWIFRSVWYFFSARKAMLTNTYHIFDDGFINVTMTNTPSFASSGFRFLGLFYECFRHFNGLYRFVLWWSNDSISCYWSWDSFENYLLICLNCEGSVNEMTLLSFNHFYPTDFVCALSLND